MTNYLRAMYYLLSMLRRTRWSRERLRKYRNFRVREIVRYAYEHVPYYHEKFNELKIKPSDVRTVEDLKKLPIIRKDEVRRNLDKLISREYDVAKLKKLKTSGSTGEPLFFYLSGAEDEFRKAKHVRANMAVGQRLRDRWVTITAPVHFNEAGRLQRILGVYVPISVSVFEDVSTQLSKIEGLKPDVIDGYASSLMLLARELERRGLDTVKPRLMISGAEALNLFSPRFIEDVFNAPIYDQYAAAEFERLAWQCEERSGYHIDADTVVMEFVDENGEWVAPGETGEIVCTSLFNHAMPFIRYALEDLGTPSEERDCPCGRTFPLMKVVEGRVNDVVVLPDGRVMSSVTFITGMYQLSFFKNIERFRVVQRRVDSFKFMVKLSDSGLDLEAAEKELETCFKTLLNVDEVDFELEFVDDIPLDKSGKFRVVVSEVAQRYLRGM